MKKILAAVAILFIAQSCQYFKSKPKVSQQPQKRVTAQINESHYHSKEIVKTFNSLMNEPYLVIEPNGVQRQAFIVRAKSYVVRQFDFLYIGQGLLHDFDKELDKLVNLKRKKGTLSNDDTQKINLLYFQLQVARTVYEENLHELSDLYRMTLETRLATEISGDSDLRAKTNLALSQLPMWLSEAREERFTIGAIAVADAINDVNTEMIARTPAIARYAVNVDQFFRLSNRERQRAFVESKDPEVLKAFKKLNAFVEGSAQKKYEEALADAERNPEKLMLPFFDDETRKPNKALDDLYPAPDGHGHISGNLVPKNTWTMTFDDGPHPQHTPAMMKVMNDNKIPAMFLMLSKNMNLYPDLVQQMRSNLKKNGVRFHVASHSMNHANLPTLSEKDLEVEITDAAQLFEKVVGERPTFFRCPYGACGPMGSKIRQIIAKNNMLHVHWNVDPLDWQDKNPQSIFERSKKQIDLRGKGIILFHDVHPQSVEAVKLLMPYMKSKGYRMIGLPEMVSEIREKDYYSP